MTELTLSEQQKYFQKELELLNNNCREILDGNWTVKYFVERRISLSEVDALQALRERLMWFAKLINDLVISSGYPAVLAEIDNHKAEEMGGDFKKLRIPISSINLCLQNVVDGNWSSLLSEAEKMWESTASNIQLFLDPLIVESKILGLHRLSEDVSNKLESLEQERQTRQAAQGAETYGEECGKAISYHKIASYVALGAFCFSVFLAFRIVFWQSTADGQLFFWFGPEAAKLPEHAEAWHFVSYAVSKLILASFAVGICVITCRVYLAHQHNIITLRHQKLASTAMRDFFDTIPADNADARLNVVIQCVTAITAREPSGFLKEDVRDYTAYTPLIKEVASAVKK